MSIKKRKMESSNPIQKKVKRDHKLLIGATFAAIVASLCCITPVFAFLAGLSGIATTFAFLEPLRPYLIIITILILAFAWYQKLKPKSKEEFQCECEEGYKPKFWHSKIFLGIVTVLAILLLTFPYYAHIFYSDKNKEVIYVKESNTELVMFHIDGMFCNACEEHVKHAIGEVVGVLEANASYKEGTATVKFDKTKTSVEQITDAINDTGYKVTDSNKMNSDEKKGN